jgi:hypothetical protein
MPVWRYMAKYSTDGAASFHPVAEHVVGEYAGVGERRS